jgi:hypothetical protein
MGPREWIRRLMESDDGYEEDPNEIVTVGMVNAGLALIVVSELEAAGIHAQSVEQRAAYAGVMTARILCFARDRVAAIEIIDRILADGSNDSD